ncbi:UBN2 domain-containing protein [Tanacetum coccineum]
MSTSNQQTLADSGANERPPMLEKGNYIPWESRFRRFLDNKLEDGERMWNSIQNGPYKRPMIPNPDNDQQTILEPLSKMTEVDACKNVKNMWERIKRFMFGFDVTSHVRHSRLMDEFDKFAAKEVKSLESVYKRLTTLVNIMDRNNVHPILHPKQRKLHYDPLALLVYLNASSSHSHANSSYSPQPYYVTHPSSVVDYKDEYQGELQGDSQEDKLTSSNIRNQARVPRTELTPGKANVQCYNCNEKGHYARDYQKPRVRDAKYFREQMLLALKDEAGSNLNNKENDFMIDSSYGDETMERS